jgi:hypothetical protein
MKFLRLKRFIGNLHSPFLKQGLPLFEAVTLARRRIIQTGYYRKETHLDLNESDELLSNCYRSSSICGGPSIVHRRWSQPNEELHGPCACIEASTSPPLFPSRISIDRWCRRFLGHESVSEQLPKDPRRFIRGASVLNVHIVIQTRQHRTIVQNYRPDRAVVRRCVDHPTRLP